MVRSHVGSASLSAVNPLNQLKFSLLHTKLGKSNAKVENIGEIITISHYVMLCNVHTNQRGTSFSSGTQTLQLNHILTVGSLPLTKNAKHSPTIYVYFVCPTV